MSLDVYLNFNGNCREAVEMYHRVFGTEAPRFMTFGEAPPNPQHPLPDTAKDLIMHTQLQIHGTNVMCSDVMPGMPFVQGNNFSLTVVSKDENEIRSVYEALQEGGNVHMPLQKTFWSPCYGMLTDRFGTSWQLSLAAE